MRLDRLVVDRHRSVARVRLSGEPLDEREAAELVAVAGDLAEDHSVRAVVVTSRGRNLCPGPASTLDALAFRPDPAAALAALRPPVVAACGGEVASVGLELALAADVRLADASARLSLPDVAEGRLPCWGGTQRLPRAVGPARAVTMLLLGAALDAPAALASGLVHQVVDVDDLDGAVDDLAGHLAGLAPLALELAKEAVWRGVELPMADGLRLEGDLNHLLQTTADRAEGLEAFFAKREPRFAGR
ncbi:MAG TPA: enoyl-CoA hydratase-related protein [Acidimicrobiales bacterium]|nr:enoyl-CoA hydratase-related protein [Acidimicrobiales bacterium]